MESQGRELCASTFSPASSQTETRAQPAGCWKGEPQVTSTVHLCRNGTLPSHQRPEKNGRETLSGSGGGNPRIRLLLTEVTAGRGLVCAAEEPKWHPRRSNPSHTPARLHTHRQAWSPGQIPGRASSTTLLISQAGAPSSLLCLLLNQEGQAQWFKEELENQNQTSLICWEGPGKSPGEGTMPEVPWVP